MKVFAARRETGSQQDHSTLVSINERLSWNTEFLPVFGLNAQGCILELASPSLAQGIHAAVRDIDGELQICSPNVLQVFDISVQYNLTIHRAGPIASCSLILCLPFLSASVTVAFAE